MYWHTLNHAYMHMHSLTLTLETLRARTATRRRLLVAYYNEIDKIQENYEEMSNE